MGNLTLKNFCDENNTYARAQMVRKLFLSVGAKELLENSNEQRSLLFDEQYSLLFEMTRKAPNFEQMTVRDALRYAVEECLTEESEMPENPGCGENSSEMVALSYRIIRTLLVDVFLPAAGRDGCTGSTVIKKLREKIN